MNKKITLILFVFFAIALGLRTYKLGIFPESLTWDETALSYNTYSLLKTGADEYGYKFPLVLRSFDDYKPALYAYFSVPVFFINGISIFSIRFVSALSGASLVFSLYLLGLNLTGSKKVGLIASFLSIFSPLSLLYSRMALEAHLSLALFIAGLAFIIRKNHSKSFFAGLFFLILSAYAYHSSRYVVPFIVLAALYASLGKQKIFIKTKILALFGFLYLPIAYFVLNPEFNTRFRETSIFTKRGSLLGSFVDVGNVPALFEIVSRGYFYLLDVFGRYLGYFNPYNIFIKSSGHDLYHPNGIGILNAVELPFWIFGGYLIIHNRKKYHPAFFIALFLSAVPAAATLDWFSPLRAVLIWPLYLIVIAMGVEKTIPVMKKKTSALLVGIIVFCAWSYYAALSFETVVYYRTFAYAGVYQYGFAQTVPYVADLIEHHTYDQVIVDSPHAQPHIFWLNYSKYPPSEYQKEIQWRVNDHTDRHNFDFGPYTFREIYWPDDRSLSNSLFVGDVESLPFDQIQNTQNAHVLKEFYNPDGSISFRVVEIQ